MVMANNVPNDVIGIDLLGESRYIVYFVQIRPTMADWLEKPLASIYILRQKSSFFIV